MISIGFAQNTPQNYPERIYKSIEDFNAFKPYGSTGDFTIKIGKDTISHRFFSTATEKRFRKEFAFSYGENVYVSLAGIVKNLPKEDRGQMVDGGNYCLKALRVGGKYLYFEDYFSSQNAQLLGGTIAAAASRRLKGLVYDRDNHSFNLFRNAEDFERFIEKNHPQYLPKPQETLAGAKRKKKVEDLNLIREVIFEINKTSAI